MRKLWLIRLTLMYRYHLAILFIMTSKNNYWEIVLDIYEVMVILKT